MKQVKAVQANTLAEFADAMNEAYCELSRFLIEQTEKISDLSALIYYDIPDELIPQEPDLGPEPDYDIEFPDCNSGNDTVTIRIKVGKTDGRHCCECDNYRWGRGCPYRDGHIRMMDQACKMFNIILEGRF